jgi:hypothetical protein
MEMIAAILAASSDGPVWLLAGGPAAGGGMYFGLWRFYRNTHRSHGFERETKVAAQQITGGERKVDEITGTSSSSVDGNNISDHRERVQRVS